MQGAVGFLIFFSTTNLTGNLPVKKLKSVKIWQNCGDESEAPVFGPPCGVRSGRCSGPAQTWFICTAGSRTCMRVEAVANSVWHVSAALWTWCTLGDPPDRRPSWRQPTSVHGRSDTQRTWAENYNKRHYIFFLSCIRHFADFKP